MCFACKHSRIYWCVVVNWILLLKLKIIMKFDCTVWQIECKLAMKVWIQLRLTVTLAVHCRCEKEASCTEQERHRSVNYLLHLRVRSGELTGVIVSSTRPFGGQLCVYENRLQDVGMIISDQYEYTVCLNGVFSWVFQQMVCKNMIVLIKKTKEFKEQRKKYSRIEYPSNRASQSLLQTIAHANFCLFKQT